MKKEVTKTSGAVFYWVSAIIQNKGDEKPSLLALNDGYPTLEAAKNVVAHIKRDNTVLSVWIDAFDKENNKETVFHECYIDAFGTVWPTKECGGNG